MFKFLEFDRLTDGEIDLVISERVPGNRRKRYLPTYKYQIRLHGGTMPIGRIELRVGQSDELYYGGHIGYAIEPEYRGHRYASKACLLLKQVAEAHKMEELFITCNPENVASRRTIELAGLTWVELAELPQSNVMYRQGERQKCIYRWDLTVPMAVPESESSPEASRLLAELLNELFRLYPEQDIQDIYKATFQACMGPEHILADTERAIAYLDEEFTQVDSLLLPNEPLLVHLGRGVYRLNLRPAKRQGLSVESIGQAFIASRVTPQDRQLLIQMVQELGSIDLTRFGISAQARDAFLAGISPELGAVHHSAAYRLRYLPAYRLIYHYAVRPEWRAD